MFVFVTDKEPPGEPCRGDSMVQVKVVRWDEKKKNPVAAYPQKLFKYSTSELFGPRSKMASRKIRLTKCA